jgi:hypothetical protein
MESASDPTVPPLLAPVDNIEVEKFVTKKYDEYSNEGKRLGNFNPELYIKVFSNSSRFK